MTSTAPATEYLDYNHRLERSGLASAHERSVADPASELFIPSSGDVAEPLVTILVPAMNESKTIQDFLAWCREGGAKVAAQVEILIADSSSDETPELCLENGARVA